MSFKVVLIALLRSLHCYLQESRNLNNISYAHAKGSFPRILRILRLPFLLLRAPLFTFAFVAIFRGHFRFWLRPSALWLCVKFRPASGPNQTFPAQSGPFRTTNSTKFE